MRVCSSGLRRACAAAAATILVSIGCAEATWALSFAIDPTASAVVRISLIAVHPELGLQEKITELRPVGLSGQATATSLPSAQVLIDTIGFGWSPETVTFALPGFGETATVVIAGGYGWSGICCLSPDQANRRATGPATTFSLSGTLDVSGSVFGFVFGLADYINYITDSSLGEGSAHDDPVFRTDLNVLDMGESSKQISPRGEFDGFLGEVGGLHYWIEVSPFVGNLPVSYSAVAEPSLSLLMAIGLAGPVLTRILHEWSQRELQAVAHRRDPCRRPSGSPPGAG